MAFPTHTQQTQTSFYSIRMTHGEKSTQANAKATDDMQAQSTYIQVNQRI
jgi:hypothetical protein